MALMSPIKMQLKLESARFKGFTFSEVSKFVMEKISKYVNNIRLFLAFFDTSLVFLTVGNGSVTLVS